MRNEDILKQIQVETTLLEEIEQKLIMLDPPKKIWNWKSTNRNKQGGGFLNPFERIQVVKRKLFLLKALFSEFYSHPKS